jgi:hypothetical protein
MVVVVIFLGGDLDRPFITGCLPNAMKMPPLPPRRGRLGDRRPLLEALRTHATAYAHWLVMI